MNILFVLVEPIAKALLKQLVGDTGADIGMGLLGLVKKKYTDDAQAKTLVAAARKAATEVIEGIAGATGPERPTEEALEAAARELAETIEQHLSITLMLDNALQQDRIVRALDMLRTAPFEAGSPEEAAYQMLQRALIAAILPLVPKFDAFQVEFDGRMLVAREKTQATLDRLDKAQSRADADWWAHQRAYCRGLADALDRVEIIGLDMLDAKVSESRLSIAYLSLAVRVVRQDRTFRIDYQELLTLLPLLGNSLGLEGVAGSGKTTLLRWTAIQAARAHAGGARPCRRRTGPARSEPGAGGHAARRTGRRGRLCAGGSGAQRCQGDDPRPALAAPPAAADLAAPAAARRGL
jgi:hypothetical protein